MKNYGFETYEGQTYKTVVIGTQTWMAENLNYNVTGSRCYEDDPANCATYGRLYSWAMAMNIDNTYNNSLYTASPNHQGICPDGWHIPSSADWNTLMKSVNPACDNDAMCLAGKKLKAIDYWEEDDLNSGTDDFGFSAQPGGLYNSVDGFINLGIDDNLWSTTEASDENAYTRAMYNHNDEVQWEPGLKWFYLFSVRCVKN